jgi:hypothetical protein
MTSVAARLGITRFGLLTVLLEPMPDALGFVPIHHPRSHHWMYPPACCHGDENSGECDRIPANTVTEVDGGWIVLLGPGDHRKVTSRHRFFIPYGDELPSGDADYHICLHPTESDENCFFVPPGAV